MLENDALDKSWLDIYMCTIAVNIDYTVTCVFIDSKFVLS